MVKEEVAAVIINTSTQFYHMTYTKHISTYKNKLFEILMNHITEQSNTRTGQSGHISPSGELLHY